LYWAQESEERGAGYKRPTEGTTNLRLSMLDAGRDSNGGYSKLIGRERSIRYTGMPGKAHEGKREALG